MEPIAPWTAWLVSALLVEAAIIDGRKLKVPNWLTFHLAAGGLAYATWVGGGTGLAWSLGGLALGLALLMPLHMIGGMGAGDVKLLAGVGAWMGPSIVLGSFVVSAFAGALMAVAMVVRAGDVAKHWLMFQTIGHEILAIRNPERLARIAAERKPTMMLLPYGIPIAIGSIGYFGWLGLFA
jgi:prepilin peptidase CpaA